MSSSSDDEIELVYDTFADNEALLTPEQIRQLERRWPIFILYDQRTIEWMSREYRIPVQKIISWDAERRERRNTELAQERDIQRPSHAPSGSASIQSPPATIHSIPPMPSMRSTIATPFVRQVRNIMSGLHRVFPIQDHRITSIQFPALFRERLLIRCIQQARSSYNLLIFVDYALPGNSADERLKSLEKVTTKTCIPMYVGKVVSGGNDSIRRQLKLNYELSHWKYLKFYDIYKLKVNNALRRQILNARSTSEYRKQTVLTTIKILASRVVQSQQLPQYNMEFINTKDGCQLLGRCINHLTNEEAIETARVTFEHGISLLCPRITSVQCVNQECPHIIHLDELELIHEVDKQLELDNRKGIPIALYRMQTFNLGDIFLPHHQNPDHYVPRLVRDQERDLANLHKKLNGYRSIQTDFYVYVAVGVRMDDKTRVPPYLTLELIRNGLNAYMYVGRSRYPGIPLHHFNSECTHFAKSIRMHKLNVFWVLRNFKCNSFYESEMKEALYQVMLLHIKKISQFPNLECTNYRLEISALDFITDAQLQQMFEVLSQNEFRFLFDSRDQIPADLNFGFLENPFILNESERCFF